jgi:hypothetical protein
LQGEPQRGKVPGPAQKVRTAGPQKTDNLDRLYADAAVAQTELAELTENIAKEYEGQSLCPPTLKGRARAMEKIATDYDNDASRIVDLARSSVVFRRPAQVAAALRGICARSRVIRVKDRFAKPVNGYRDILLNIEMGNGHVVEMQLHLRAILKAKNGPAHALYEQARTIKARARAEGRALTRQERLEIVELDNRARTLYEEAFHSAEGGDQ